MLYWANMPIFCNKVEMYWHNVLVKTLKYKVCMMKCASELHSLYKAIAVITLWSSVALVWLCNGAIVLIFMCFDMMCRKEIWCTYMLFTKRVMFLWCSANLGRLCTSGEFSAGDSRPWDV